MKKTIALVTLILIIAMSVIVYAASTATVRLSADKTSLVAGDEITLTFQLASVTGMEAGIKALQGTIEYDTNIFEPITASSKVDMNGWSTELNTANNMFAGTSNGSTSGGIFTLKLKVKQGITAKSTTVTIKDIKTADTANDDAVLNISNASVTIGSSIITPTNNTVNGNQAGTNNSTTTNNLVNTNKKDNTIVSSNTLPKTGIYPYVIIAIVVVAAVATVSIVRYKNIMK